MVAKKKNGSSEESFALVSCLNQFDNGLNGALGVGAVDFVEYEAVGSVCFVFIGRCDVMMIECGRVHGP